ncbi:MAG: hypothetical protein Q9225_006508, partial [Loekoesia sp. 1 TL-2023]
GNARGLYDVDVMRCKNQGSDYDDQNIQWTCTASLPSEFKLGSTDVICEGYESSSDPYVLKGSCGVEYRLILTDIGEQEYGHKSRNRFYDDDFAQSDGSRLGSVFLGAGVVEEAVEEAAMTHRLLTPVIPRHPDGRATLQEGQLMPQVGGRASGLELQPEQPEPILPVIEDKRNGRRAQEDGTGEALTMEKGARWEGQGRHHRPALHSPRQGIRAPDLGLRIGGEAALPLATPVADFHASFAFVD